MKRDERKKAEAIMRAIRDEQAKELEGRRLNSSIAETLGFKKPRRKLVGTVYSRERTLRKLALAQRTLYPGRKWKRALRYYRQAQRRLKRERASSAFVGKVDHIVTVLERQGRRKGY